MITELHLENFKCFADQRLAMAPLTLLAGLNGMGKSSVIQSLLLLRQSYMDGCLQRGLLSLSGDLVDLGTVSDVWFEGAKEDLIGISISVAPGNDGLVRFVFQVTPERDAAVILDTSAGLAAVDRVLQSDNASVLLTGLISDEPPTVGFHYLHAERFGPRKFLPMQTALSGALDLGPRGEYVLHALATYQDSVILSPNDPRTISDVGERLRDQLEVWLGEVSPGVRLSIKPVPEADLMVSGFSFGEAGQLRSRDFRATNVGFGLSYVLPVLVALLATPPGGIVLVENAEAHMHPRGQTRLGDLCARAAAAGVQVVIETHSDHVMDGVRIAIREGRLASSDAVFHYFQRRSGVAEVVTPAIDSEGRLDEWPDGFFDQHRRNTARLIRPKLV